MKKFKVLIAALFVISSLFAQETYPPFWNDIQHFKEEDSIKFPPKNVVLLVGSSSFTKWIDAQEYFPATTIINRGFGGSTMPDLIRYANEIIIPYHPKQVVIYCGENDLASSDTISAQTVFDRFVTLFHIIRKQLPGVPVAFVSLKPSPSREKLWPKMVEANSLIKTYISKQKNAAFIDVYNKMFNADGTVMKDIFIEDNLHMNAKGYAIWQQVMKPYLK